MSARAMLYFITERGDASARAGHSAKCCALPAAECQGGAEPVVPTKVIRTGCVYFLKGCCARGASCPYAHAGADRQAADQAKAQGLRGCSAEEDDLDEVLPSRLTLEYNGEVDCESDADLAEHDPEEESTPKNFNTTEGNTPFALFEALPPEMVWLVIERLKHHDLAQLAGTCHRMAELVRNPLLWKLHYECMWGKHGACPDRPADISSSSSSSSEEPSFTTLDEHPEAQPDVEQVRKEKLVLDVATDWRGEYRARLEYEHRGWKAKNIQRLSKKVTNVDTHHNATFITSLAVSRPPDLDPNKVTKVKASCFVLVVDRTTSSIHRKGDYLAIAPNWELDNGIVRVIEMKSYKKKKTLILKPQSIASPLLARFSTTVGDGRMVIAPQHQEGHVEVWSWADDQLAQRFPVSCRTTALDFSYNDLALGDAEGVVGLYDLRTSQAGPLSRLCGHTDKVTCMQRSGDLMATGSGDGTVRVWDLRKGSAAPMFQLEGHAISFVSSLQFDSQKLIFSAVHSPPSSHFWYNAKDRNPFRYQMLHVWNSRTFEFWNSLDFSKECVEASSPLSFDFEGNFLVVGVPKRVVMLNFYNSTLTEQEASGGGPRTRAAIL